MDDIQTRLQETSKNCLEAYAAWVGKKQDRKAQEDLHAAIHELRKVSSRLEIELAVSERDQMTAKPLPIPAHKSMNNGDAAHILDSGAAAGDAQAATQKPASRRRRQHSRKQGDS